MTTPVVVSIITSFIAAVIAIWGVSTQRTIARRRATIDFIARQAADGDIIAARRKFIELAKAAGGLAPWADDDKEKSDEVSSIRTILNEMELIAIAIQKGVIDYDLFSRWNRSSALKYWEYGGPFILAVRARTQNQAIYHEFEQLVVWLKGKDGKMPKRNMWRGKWF